MKSKMTLLPLRQSVGCCCIFCFTSCACSCCGHSHTFVHHYLSSDAIIQFEHLRSDGEMSEAQAMFYLIKYLLKDPNPRASTLSLAKAARQDITAYPSVAENTVTDVRTAQHWMNRIINMFNGQGEFSHQVVVSALLGIPEPMSHRAQTFN